MTELKPNKLKVVIAGASGYIGQNLLAELTGHAEIIGLSRSGGKDDAEKQIEWRSCDLFSMIDAEKGVAGADIGVYLVHSMMKSAKLTQARFEDMDVILADNFAQAARKQGIKHIVYLTGIIPGEEDEANLSRHLKSRLEVERILSSYGIPVTALRAGLIIGPEGSSFPILTKLIRRLPIMALPKWTRTDTQPVALEDVIKGLANLILDYEPEQRIIDIGGPEVMSYKVMMKRMADVLGKKRIFWNVPFFTVGLSKLWLRLITQTPKEIVYPLIESLKHPMIVSSEHVLEGISDSKITFLDSAKQAVEEEEAMDKKKPAKLPKLGPIIQDVRSIQRIQIPDHWTADDVARYYVFWLAKFLNPWIRTTVDEDLNCKIGFIGNKILLELQYEPERSTEDRALYYISEGLLIDSDSNERGRMEFRRIPGSNDLIIGIHDYLPSVPWFIYNWTQAKMHAFVMANFRRHMRKQKYKKYEHLK